MDSYTQVLRQYTCAQLCTKPAPSSWSLGQMYLHLNKETTYYLEQIKLCFSNNDHTTEQAAPTANNMFANDEFPDEFIEGASANAFIPQPESKDLLLKELMTLKFEGNSAAVLVFENTFAGKTKHSGLDHSSLQKLGL